MKTLPLPRTWFQVGLLLGAFKSLSAFSLVLPWPDGLDDLFSALAAACFALSLVQKGFSPKRMAVYALILALTLLSALKTGTFPLVLTALTCMALYREDFDDAIRLLLFWESVYAAVHILWSAVMGSGFSIEVSGELRFGFGFSHPNVFSVIAMNLLGMWCWLHFDSFKPVQAGTLVASSLLIYAFTGSRSLVCAALVLATLALLRSYGGLLRPLACVCLPAVALTEYALWRGFGNSLSDIADKLLSGRIKLGAYALEHFGLTALGQNLTGITVRWDEYWQLNRFTFDDIYSYLAVGHGALWLAVLAVLFYRAARRGSPRVWAFLILFTLYGVTEVHVLNPYLFFPVLLTGWEGGVGNE